MALRAKRIAQGDAIDENAETATLTGPVVEDSEPATQRIAKRLGWKPKEEWDRDPESWVDDVHFLENTADQVQDLRARNQELRERSERSARAAAEAIEQDRQRVREESQRTIRESDNPEERSKAAARLAESAGPPPQTTAWLAKNPWFDDDPLAATLARTICAELGSKGVSFNDQLAEAEKEVRKRFPEHFERVESRPTGEEVPLSRVRAPAVQPGTRAAPSQTKEKGFADIPSADRQAFRTNLLKHFMSHGQTQAQAETRYARSYWGEGVLHPSERDADPWVNEKKSNPWGRR